MTETEEAAFDVAMRRRGLVPTANGDSPGEQVVTWAAQTVEALAAPLGGDPTALRWLAAALEAWSVLADAEAARQVPELLTLDDLAERFEWKVSTARQYRSDGTLPAPDATIGRTPVWLPATITAWEPTRPGQGHGGGRRRSEQLLGARGGPRTSPAGRGSGALCVLRDGRVLPVRGGPAGSGPAPSTEAIHHPTAEYVTAGQGVEHWR